MTMPSRVVGERAVGEEELDVDRGGVFLVVLHLGLGESRARAGGPVDGFLGLVDQPFFDELGEGAENFGLVAGIEREVGVRPVAEDAEALELVALDVDELAGEFFRAAADFHGRQALVLLDDLELDGQAVAVPAGEVGRAEPGHRLGFDDEVLEDLVESGAHVDIAVGEGRAVVEHELGGVLPRGLNLAVEVRFLPVGEEFGFAGDQIRLHGKIGLWQVERVFIAGAHVATAAG